MRSEMIEAVASKLKDIRGLARKHGVTRLWLFGSAAKPAARFDAESDLDFLVEINREEFPLRGFQDPFWQVLMDLESLFPGRRVDLVEWRQFKDQQFAEELLQTRRLLYADPAREEASV